MREDVGDIWTYHSDFILIPTNMALDKNGLGIMGAGVAKQVKDRYPNAPRNLAKLIQEDILVGIIASEVDGRTLLSFATKRNPRSKATLGLIELSMYFLLEQYEISPLRWTGAIYTLPNVGCGLGGLDWEADLKPVLSRCLPDNVIVLWGK